MDFVQKTLTSALRIFVFGFKLSGDFFPSKSQVDWLIVYYFACETVVNELQVLIYVMLQALWGCEL